MKRFFSILLVTLSFVSCSSTPQKTAENDAATYFPNMDGCFLLYNVKTASLEKVVGEERCRKQLPACSTFKVPLAVMAFDAKLIKDENQTLKWDGKKGEREAERRDHNAKSWMKDSVIWFSQNITQKMGKKKLQTYLDKFNYGNKDLSAGITEAWLVSPAGDKPALKISAYEQLEFMKKLWSDQLPASKQAQQLAREITFIETSPGGYQLHGKTGSNFYDSDRKIHLGWFISHLERGDQEYIAIANFSDLAPVEVKGFGGLRVREITKKILSDLGKW